MASGTPSRSVCFTFVCAWVPNLPVKMPVCKCSWHSAIYYAAAAGSSLRTSWTWNMCAWCTGEPEMVPKPARACAAARLRRVSLDRLVLWTEAGGDGSRRSGRSYSLLVRIRYRYCTDASRGRTRRRRWNPDSDRGHYVITFHFAAVLAPIFWSLRPLFIRQKRDILAADTALLEREYALDQRGFQRQESRAPRVIVYGGNGFFGRIIVDDLLRHTTAKIEIASRTAQRIEFAGFESRVRFVESDLHDQVSVLRTIAGADMLIVAAVSGHAAHGTAGMYCRARAIH